LKEHRRKPGELSAVLGNQAELQDSTSARASVTEGEALWPQKKSSQRAEQSRCKGKEQKRREREVSLSTIISSPCQGSTALTC